jgi:hypothetical protein
MDEFDPFISPLHITLTRSACGALTSPTPSNHPFQAPKVLVMTERSELLEAILLSTGKLAGQWAIGFNRQWRIRVQSSFSELNPEMLPMMPRFTIERVRRQLDTSFPTATAAVKVLEDLGIVAEMTGQKKNAN